LYFMLVAGGFMLGNFASVRLTERFEALTIDDGGHVESR
jgi:hypothetical protein